MATKLRVNVARSAERDIEIILEWTIDRFGRDAELRYRRLIRQAFRDLAADPTRPGVGQLAGLSAGVRGYHLISSRSRARSKLGIVKKPRHLVVFRVTGETVTILRLLHDEQELSRHMPDFD